MSCLKIIVLYLFTASPFTEAIGQINHALRTEFITDSVSIEPGQTFSNELSIINAGKDTIHIDSIQPTQVYPGILFTPEFSASLVPGESRILKVKMIADDALMQTTLRSIQYFIYYTQNKEKKISKASFNIVRPTVRHLLIGTSSGEAYFNPSVIDNTITLFVENPGYENKNILLKYQLSPEAYLTTELPQENISLAPKERKLVMIQLMNRNKNAFYPDYSLSVTAYESGSTEPIAATVIPVRTLAEKRNMSYGNRGSNLYKNYAELRFNRSNQSNEFVQFRSNFEQRTGPGKIMEFNSTADYFIHYGLLNLYDTWLSFQTPKTVSRIGNINAQGYDMNIAGRGASFQYKITPRTQVELLGTNNSFLLYSSSPYTSDPGYSIGTRIEHRISTSKIMNASYVFNQNNFTGVLSHLATINSPLVHDTTHSLVLEAGASSSEAIHHRTKYPGAALGLSYELNYKKISFLSNNYFSSSYYAGLRKGALNLYELMRYNLANSSHVFLLYSGSVNKPKFVADDSSHAFVYQANNHFTTHLFEMGYSRTIKGYAFTLAPNYNYQLYSVPGTLQYEAYRTKMNIAKSYQQHALNFTIDYGIGKIVQTDTTFQSTRLLLNYRLGSFYIDGLASFNPANVYEVSMVHGREPFRNYSLTAGYHLNPSRSKLSGTAYVGYNYITTYNSKNYFSSALLNYSMGSDWHTTGNITYSSFQNSSSHHGFNNFQFSIGLKKNFTRWSAAASDQNNVTLEVFEDLDQNGRRNGKEPLLPGIIVQLNKSTVAITDSKGKIKLNQVPEASYHITAQKNHQSLDILWGDSIRINRNSTYAIPIIKTYVQDGSLKEIRAAYDIQVQDASGITIYAQNIQTEKTYHTVTSFDGQFQLKLPAGFYRVYIRNDRYTITDNNQELEVGQATQHPQLIFHYRNKEVKIDVKHF